MSNEQNSQTQQVSSGVQALIDRLKDEGVEAGREAGERIIADAEKRAEWLVEQAEEEAKAIVDKAKDEATFVEKAGREALAMAVRDSQLFLHNQLLGSFAAQINELITQAMSQSDLLEKMVLEIAAQSRPKDTAVSILLGESSMTNPKKLTPEAADALTQFVSQHAKDLLAKGVDIAVSEDPGAAMRILLRDQQAEVDLSDKTVAALILRHIQPRFRTLLEGLMT